MSNYIMQRRNPRTGFVETLTYTGSLSNKPKGWKVIKKLKQKV
jgi:hypothetical protein